MKLQRKPKVYFSVPVTYDWDTFKTFMKACSTHFECVYWERETRYDEHQLFMDLDAIVIVTPNNNWIKTIESLPAGVRKELRNCIKKGVPVYLAYKPIYQDTCNIYNIDIHKLRSGILEGCRGTANNIVQELCSNFSSSLPKLPSDTHKAVTTKYNPITFETVVDKRLLLL